MNSPIITASINKFKFETVNGINIIHMNIQSIRNKIDDIEEFLMTIAKQTKAKIHIIALSEIWIFQNENKFYNINGYNAYFSNRNDNRSGGCCFFVINELKSTLLNEFEFEKSNFLIIKINKHDLKIACVYRYGNSNVINFNEKLESEVFKYKKLILVGDININLKNNDTDTREYVNSYQSNGVFCLNELNDEYFTRKSNTVNTFADPS